jgi:hypothetical protein
MFDSTRFLKRSLSSFALTSLIALLIVAVGCGGGSTAPVGANANSAVQVKIGDDPDDSVIAFEITVDSLVLTDQNNVNVQAINSPTTLELTHLADTNEPLSFLNIQQDTYKQATITVSNPEIVYLNAVGQVVEKQLNMTDTVTISFTPDLVVGPGSSVVNLDLNLAHSVTINLASGSVSVNPVFVVTTSAVPPAGQEDQEDENDGQLQDVWGVVTGVAANSFTLSAGLSMQPLSFNVDASTAFENISGLSQISNGMLVRVNAVTQSNGDLLAKRVVAVEMDNASEADGIITAVNSNPASQITVLDQDGVGQGMTANMLGTTLNVAITPNTAFHMPEEIDLSNLPFTPAFDASSVKAGQRVEADTNTGVGPSATLSATNIELRRQAVHGTVANYNATGSGQFTFTLNLPVDSYLTRLSNGSITSVSVVQQPSTELRGLSTVANGANVRVRGVLFWTGSGFTMVAGRIVAVQ